jgi:hypothetical protein
VLAPPLRAIPLAPACAFLAPRSLCSAAEPLSVLVALFDAASGAALHATAVDSSSPKTGRIAKRGAHDGILASLRSQGSS